MKLLKVMAALLAVCLLGSAMVACAGGNDKESATDSETEAVPSITVTLKVEAPKGSDDEDIEEAVTGKFSTLGEVIQYYCEVINSDESDDTPFNSLNMLQRIGSWEAGESEQWIAYFEGEGGGKSNPLKSIYNQAVEDGETYVLYIGE